VHGQPAAVTSVDGRLYAASTPDAVSASADGGRTWTQLGGGLGGARPNQVIGYEGSLWAATSGGLYRFPLAVRGGATPSWWIMLLGLAIALGLAAIGVGTLYPRPLRGLPPRSGTLREDLPLLPDTIVSARPPPPCKSKPTSLQKPSAIRYPSDPRG
jgi:hypothetical protein